MAPPPTEPSKQPTSAAMPSSNILKFSKKLARGCLCHRRHFRCHRCFHNSSATDRVGSGSCDSVAAFRGAGPAVVAIAGTGSGGYSGLGRLSILAAGGGGGSGTLDCSTVL